MFPKTFDWRKRTDIIKHIGWTNPAQYITHVKDQEACGACYALSTTSVLSDRLNIITNTSRYNVSSEPALACLSKCEGGSPMEVIRYLETNGFVSEQCAPYNDDVPNCVDLSPCPVIGYVNPDSVKTLIDPESIRREILGYGPVVGVFRIFNDWTYGAFDKQPWKVTNGVYCHFKDNDVYRYPQVTSLYKWHAVEIVGWGEKTVLSKPVKYWIVKNTFGDDWNENGYFNFAVSDPETGLNVDCGLDTPVKIYDTYHGGVNAFLPDEVRFASRTLRVG